MTAPNNPNNSARVLFVVHSPRNEKTAVYMGYVNKKKAYEKHGWKVDILSPTDFKFSSRAGRFMPLVYPFQAAFWLFKTGAPFDLIIFHSYAGWVFQLLKKFFLKGKKRFKTAVAFHGVEELFFRAMIEEGRYSGRPVSFRFRLFYCFLLVPAIKMSCKKADKIFCLNRREKEFLEAANYQTSDKIVVRPNDIPSKFFTAKVYRPKAETLLFVGQWLPMKGTRYLVSAFEQLAQSHDHLQLLVAGTLKNASQVLKDFPPHLHPRIRVAPEAAHENMLDYYQQADIFILPSLFEAFNRAMVEAMASGLPAISTLVGVADHYLTEGTDYIQIPFRSAKAIVEAVTSLIDNPQRRETLGQTGQKTVRIFDETIALESCFQGNVKLLAEPFS